MKLLELGIVARIKDGLNSDANLYCKMITMELI